MLRDRFRRLLSSSSTTDLAAGWQLALDGGRPFVPLLWELVDAERANVFPRLAMLGAAVLAGGAAEDARLLRYLGQPRVRLEERALVALLVALGSDRTRPAPEFWPTFLGGSKAPERLLAVASILASVRFPGTGSAPVLDTDDPGAAAAAAYAGLPLPASVAARFWNLRTPERHAELVWRGALLGAARNKDHGEAMRRRGQDVLALPGEAMAAARAAATWYAATAGDLRVDGRRLDVAQLRIAIGHPSGMAQLAEALGPDPQPRDEEPERLAVGYALAHAPELVIQQRPRWLEHQQVRAHIAVALAWRIAGEAAPPVVDELPDFPEWSLVRAACGAPIAAAAPCTDPRLAAAVRLAAKGQLPRGALRLLLEETLWRWGSHPRCGVVLLERQLVRDILLAGSNPGGHKYQPSVRPDQRYIPGGLDRDDRFFSVAVALFDFLLATRAPLPPEHRLPG